MLAAHLVYKGCRESCAFLAALGGCGAILRMLQDATQVSMQEVSSIPLTLNAFTRNRNCLSRRCTKHLITDEVLEGLDRGHGNSCAPFILPSLLQGAYHNAVILDLCKPF